MKSGYFIDNKKEYVITNHFPKRPLMNYLWNETTLVDIDQFGFGRGAIFDENRTRRNLYVIGDNRLVYIMDNKDKSYYAANRNYNKLPFENWETHVGQGYSLISSSYNGLEFNYTIFVPIEGYAECWEVKLKNTTDEVKDLSVYTMAHLMTNTTIHKSYAITDYDDDTFVHWTEWMERDFKTYDVANELKRIEVITKADFNNEFFKMINSLTIRHKQNIDYYTNDR